VPASDSSPEKPAADRAAAGQNGGADLGPPGSVAENESGTLWWVTGAEIWDHINSTLTAIKWPAVVALGGWLLRRELAGLARRLLRIEAAGAKVEFDMTQETLLLGEEISASGERVVATATATTRVSSGTDHQSTNGQADGRTTPTTNDLTPSEHREELGQLRDDLANLIEASFQAGFLAGAGAEPGGGIPTPKVYWNGSEPRITGWTYETGNVGLRELIGERLRTLRQKAGISRSDAAWAIRSSESKISRIELGRLAVAERDLADLLKLYAADEDSEGAELIRLARTARS